MTTTDIISQIREIVYKMKPDEYIKSCSIHDSFMDDLGMDSLDTLSVVMEVENRFGIDIDDDETQELKTIADIAETVQTKLEKKAGTGVCR